MATTPNHSSVKNNNSNIKGEVAGSANGKSPKASGKNSGLKVKLIDVLRSDVVRIDVVDTDFMITVKSGRKILIREGALNSTIDENFSIEFSDQEIMTGTELFSQAQTSLLPSDSNWKDFITDPTVSPKSIPEKTPNLPAPFISANLTTLALGASALALAAAGGGGGGGGGGGATSSVTPVVPPATIAEQSLQIIQDYAQTNTSPEPTSPTGVPPTVTTYTTAGVTGVTNNSVAAINDALATSAVTGTSVNTAAKVQILVDTYNAIFALADGTANNATAPQALNTAQLALIGVDITALQNSSNPSERLALLNSILDAQQTTGVNRISKINKLLGIANAIQDQASGLTTHLTTTLSVADFATIGVVGVSATNLPALLSQITTNAATGSDSLPELQSALYNSLSLSLTAISSDTGHSSSDFITNDNTLTFSGTSTAADGSTLHITLTPATGPAITLTTTVNAGVWTVAHPNALADSTYSVVTELLDATNSVVRTDTQTVTVDTSGANLADGTADASLLGKTIAITGISPDTGVTGDFKTSANQLTISGTTNAANGTHIAVNINGSTYYTTAVGGLWALDLSSNPLAIGTYIVQVVLIDSAGNESSSNASQTLTILNAQPLTLTNKTVGAIAATANLTLTFSDDVSAQANKYIRIIDESTNNTLESILVTDTNRVTISGRTVTINPTADLELGKNYHATLDADAFVTANGDTSSGITDSNTWSFRPVDPVTTVVLGGAGVDPSNGINATELSHLTLSGTMSSANLGAVSQEAITKITFTNTDDGTSFEIGSIDVTLLPTIDAVNHTWSLLNDVRWTNRLVTGKHYQVTVELSSQVSGTPTLSASVGFTGLVDLVAPILTGA